MNSKELQTREQAALEPTEGTRDRRVVAPRTDIHETGDAIVLLADMPGVDEDHVNITLERSVLTIEGTMQESSFPGHALAYGESVVRDYRRAFTLSEHIDQGKISAKVRDGVLHLTLPKAEPAKARKIQVKAG